METQVARNERIDTAARIDRSAIAALRASRHYTDLLGLLICAEDAKTDGECGWWLSRAAVVVEHSEKPRLLRDVMIGQIRTIAWGL